MRWDKCHGQRDWVKIPLLSGFDTLWSELKGSQHVCKCIGWKKILISQNKLSSKLESFFLDPFTPPSQYKIQENKFCGNISFRCGWNIQQYVCHQELTILSCSSNWFKSAMLFHLNFRPKIIIYDRRDCKKTIKKEIKNRKFIPSI